MKNDDVQVSSVTGTFSDKNAAPDKTVALSNAVYAGADKNNYLIIDQKNSTATISPKALTVSGLKAQDKVYDGNQTAQVDTSKPFAADSGLVKNDDVQVSSLEDDYWFLDCFFSSSQEFKKIKCEPGSQKKSPSIEIKKYPNKKLSALNSPLLP